MILGQLVEDFQDGSCITFIGAGISHEAKVPSAEVLARSLVQQIRFPYDIAASMSNRLIAQLPAAELVTTNWDTFTEEQLGDLCCLVVDAADLSGKPRKQHDVRLIKMRGTIERPESMVITENDYHDFLLKNRTSYREVI